MSFFEDIKKSFAKEFGTAECACETPGTNQMARTNNGGANLRPLVDQAGVIVGTTDGVNVFNNNGQVVGTYAELLASMSGSNSTVASRTLGAATAVEFASGINNVNTSPSAQIATNYNNNVAVGNVATIRTGIYSNAMILNSTLPKFLVNQVRFIRNLLTQDWNNYNTAPPFVAIFDGAGLTVNIAPPSQVITLNANTGGVNAIAWIVTATVRDLLVGNAQCTIFSQDPADQVTYTLGNQVTTFVILPRARGQVSEYAQGPYVPAVFGPYISLDATSVVTNTTPNNAADEWDPAQPIHIAGTNAELRITPYYPTSQEAVDMALKANCCGTQVDLQDMIIKHAIGSLDKDNN